MSLTRILGAIAVVLVAQASSPASVPAGVPPVEPAAATGTVAATLEAGRLPH